MNRNKQFNIIGVIHARGGSVRVPLKNIRNLAGKPLISYAITAARQSKHLRRVIVSTDYPGIKKVSLKYGAEVPFKRPERISGNCSSALVTQHTVRFVEKEEKRRVDIVVTLQPTTPFCRAEDIDSCIELLLRNKAARSVFSAVEIVQRPEWMFRLKARNRAVLNMPGNIRGRRALRQSFGKLITPNGGVYATRRKALFDEGVLISRHTLAYEMPQERSLDIDHELDFGVAETILRKKRGKNYKI